MIANITADNCGGVPIGEEVYAAPYECGGVELKFPGLYDAIETAFGTIAGSSLVDAVASRLPPHFGFAVGRYSRRGTSGA